MCASPLSFLRAGPPPPKVVLLPDALFFTRAVPVTAGATAAEVAAQVELAIEAVSPFPLAQLYYGWFWLPGAERALVFAAYRRRFTADQTASWDGTELVLPSFAALAGAAVDRATTLILSAAEGLTAVHWDDSPVPAKILFRPVAPEADDEARARVREELLRDVGGSKSVIDVLTPPAPDPVESDDEVVFRAEGLVSRLPAATAASLDVRDKGDLAALRSARKRDVILWRVAMGCAAALLILFLGEFALVAARAWQKTQVATVNRQQPTVDKIMSSQVLARQIDDLVTKQLLPFEMLAFLAGEDATRRLPSEIVFTRAHTTKEGGIYTLFVDCTTRDVGQVNLYENQLRQVPAVKSVDVFDLQPRGAQATFRMTVVFKPEALKPMALPGTTQAESATKSAATVTSTRPSP